MERDLLSKFLKVYWLRPGLALWRSIETDTIQKAIRNISIAKQEKNLQILNPAIDLGCGDGIFSWMLWGGNFDIGFDCYRTRMSSTAQHINYKTKKPCFFFDTGLDMDFNSLKRAKNIGAYKKYIQADMLSLPFKNHSFNTVFCNGVIEHQQDLTAILSEIKRIIKPYGRFITTVSVECFRKYLFYYPLTMKRRRLGFTTIGNIALKFDEGRGESHIHCYRPEQWKKEFGKAGFEVLYYKRYLPKHIIQLWDTGLRILSPLSIKVANLLDRFGLRIPIKGISIVLMRLLLNKHYKNRTGTGGFILLFSRSK